MSHFPLATPEIFPSCFQHFWYCVCISAFILLEVHWASWLLFLQSHLGSFNPYFSGSFSWCHAYVGSLCCSVTKLCLTLKDPMNCSTSGFPVLHCLHIELMSIELVMLSNHLILCRPLLLLPSNFTSISVFSSKSVLRIRWPKYWSFSFSTSPSNEYSVLISFRIDWFDLLVVHGTLENLLQYHSSKASVLQHLAFFMV